MAVISRLMITNNDISNISVVNHFTHAHHKPKLQNWQLILWRLVYEDFDTFITI